MEQFFLGIRTLFTIWADSAFAAKVQALFKEEPPPPQAPPVEKPRKEPARNDALTLLSVLQREARLIDFIQEPIAAYSDAQIGAAVRGVHDDCNTVLNRMFALQPLRPEAEGASLEVPPGFDPLQFRLTGNLPEQPPYRGVLRHPGWKATKCELPEWSGREESATVVAPCEVEIK